MEIKLEQKLTELKAYCGKQTMCETCPINGRNLCIIYCYDNDDINVKYEKYKAVRAEESKKEITDKIATYANLMPEAIEIIKYALEQESERCEQCQRKNQYCLRCLHSGRIYNMKKLLAMLEEGVDA